MVNISKKQKGKQKNGVKSHQNKPVLIQKVYSHNIKNDKPTEICRLKGIKREHKSDYFLDSSHENWNCVMVLSSSVLDDRTLKKIKKKKDRVKLDLQLVRQQHSYYKKNKDSICTEGIEGI